MNTKEKAPKGANIFIEEHDKDSNFSTTYKVLEILKTGQEVTAFGLNQTVFFNDARKAISLLREKGYPIKDRRLLDRRKVYSMPHDWEKIMSDAKKSVKQLNLFDYDSK